jgi:hypothetical protein
MKKYKFLIGFFLLLIIFTVGCGKQQTDFRKFLGTDEKIYTGSVGNVISMPGNLKTRLKWKSSSDPSIVKYVVFYNNKRDSQIVNVTTKADSVSVLIENLQEFAYSFTIYSYDAQGNRSIPTVVNNVKIYGPTYQEGLLNRPYNADVPYVAKENGQVELNFNAPDTINVTTTVKYTSTSGDIKEAELAGKDSILTLTDYKPNTEVTYTSSYKPEKNAIEVFTVSKPSVFPQILFNIECNKSIFQEHTLPGDAGLYDAGSTRVSRLWDGSVGPQSYPNIFHSDGSAPIPHTITFDMGKVYTNLSLVEETGRDCCNNPDKFEVWGIADITNAATNLRSDNPGWTNEAIAKGWVLLADVVRKDDGQKPFRVQLMPNPPPVRYIRIRVKHVTTNDGYFSNMSELTFWNKQ